MTELDEKKIKEIQDALNAVKDIKETLKGNMQILRPLMLEKKFIPFCIFCGIYSFVFFTLLFIATKFWGNWSLIPLLVKIILLFLVGLFLIIGSILKIKIMSSSIKKQNPNLSIFSLFNSKEWKYRIEDSVILIIALIAITIPIAIELKNMWLFFPAFLFYCMFEFFRFGSFFYIPEYRFLGFFCGIIIILITIFMKNNQILWIGGSLSLLFFAFAIIIYKAYKNSGSET